MSRRRRSACRPAIQILDFEFDFEKAGLSTAAANQNTFCATLGDFDSSRHSPAYTNFWNSRFNLTPSKMLRAMSKLAQTRAVGSRAFSGSRPAMADIIGIDLGTTNSCVAIMEASACTANEHVRRCLHGPLLGCGSSSPIIRVTNCPTVQSADTWSSHTISNVPMCCRARTFVLSKTLKARGQLHQSLHFWRMDSGLLDRQLNVR